VAGINAARLAEGQPVAAFPATTALGALGRYISSADVRDYQPMNMAFGLLPEPAPPIRDKRRRREAMVRRALDDLGAFLDRLAPVPSPT
jgi:methylenetetrahydrofolate--tRNA-(uracil-5-)-methyltransferase